MRFVDIREGSRLIWRRGRTVQVVSVAIATTTSGVRVLRVRPSGSLRAYNAVPADLYEDGETAARDAFGWSKAEGEP